MDDDDDDADDERDYLHRLIDALVAHLKIADLTLLSDIFPTGYHGAVTAGVKPGSTVYIAGAGPVGLASAASAHLLGAACVIVGDLIPERLAQARSFGCETVDLRSVDQGQLPDAIRAILGEPEVDASVDCVGFEARGCGHKACNEVPAQVLNDCMQVGMPVLFMPPMITMMVLVMVMARA